MKIETLAPADNIPRCTYRLQLRKDFGFREARRLVGYLAELGVSHCFTSPFFKARPGSTHGYDIIDPNDFNPEIGDEAAFTAFIRELHRAQMFLLVDHVPNHMGIMGSGNRWWLDVLENGPASAYASYFDIDWHPLKKSLRNRILVPVLGDHYGRELEAGHLQLSFNKQSGGFQVRYFEHLFPLDPRTYPLILRHNLEQFRAAAGRDRGDFPALQHIIELCLLLPGRAAASAPKKQRRRETGRLVKEKLAALAGASEVFLAHVEEIIRQLNGRTGQPHSFIALHRLLERQAFRLSYWKVAAEEINYRRFFDINDLAGVRVENEEVFAATHRLLLRLVEAGAIEGLRIDHIDGLYDPAGYLRRLHERLAALQPGRRLYLVVEKILADSEKLPPDWATHGTTGYDFASQLNDMLLDNGAEGALSRIYTGITGVHDDFAAILRGSKKHVLQQSLASELNTLANRLARLAEADWQSRDFTYNSLRQALIEIVASFGVYRTYTVGRRISETDRREISAAVKSARRLNPGIDQSLFDFIAILMLQQPGPLFHRTDRRAVRDFIMHLQQLTAPLTAKGLEDTALYRFNRLVSINEVGANPDRFGISVATFHRANRERLLNWPHAMLATSTHDSKRSEDVRARLNVLSEMAEEWGQAVRRWRRFTRRYRVHIDGCIVPDANEEYMLFQNLLGIWPLHEPDPGSRRRLQGRLTEFALKAAREAKLNSSWLAPDEMYEGALRTFISRLFADFGSRFWGDFLNLSRSIALSGLYNSLSQVLLKATAPGVPSIYQGCELWNFSLVDPDNRRPVDFSLRRQLLRELKKLDAGEKIPARELTAMVADMTDGRIKMYVIWRCLQLRHLMPELFAAGDYLPLAVTGEKRRHVCAFLRIWRDKILLAAAPRLLWQLAGGNPEVKPLAGVWGDTVIELPEEYGAGVFHCRFSGERLAPGQGNGKYYLPVSRILASFPLGLLLRQ